MRSGKSEVPWITNANGSRVRGFERKHLHGVLDILIAAGLVQRRRITDHWGTGEFDDSPVIRACMPRDLFLLFYSRFFHLAPTIGHVSKDNPEYDSKHHIRYVDLTSLSRGGR